MNEIKNNEQMVTEETAVVVTEVKEVEEKKEPKKGFFKKIGNGVKKHGKTALAVVGGVVVGAVASALISKNKNNGSDDSDEYENYEEDVIDVEYEDVEDEE